MYVLIPEPMIEKFGKLQDEISKTLHRRATEEETLATAINCGLIIVELDRIREDVCGGNRS